MERPELATLRTARGYTQDELGELIGASGLTISRYERGVSAPQGKRARLYAKALHISMTRLNALLNGATDNDSDDDDQLDDEHLFALTPKWLSVYVAIEQSAGRLEAYEPHVIHGLLQTEEYARELIQLGQTNPDLIERLVKLRMSRQPVLRRDVESLELSVILSEGAVRLQVGNRTLMHRQLDHLLEIAQRQNVIVRILPFSAGPHIADRGAFALATPQWEETPNVVYLESYLGGASYIEDASDIRKFSDLFARLRSMCLTADQSIDRIREIQEELYR